MRGWTKGEQWKTNRPMEDGTISIMEGERTIVKVWDFPDAPQTARLIAEAPVMADLLRETEDAEDAHANCEECNGEGVPELCEKCFPLFDAVRVKRRSILARLEARP